MPIYKFSNAGGFGTFQRYNDFLAGNPATLGDAGAMFPLQVVTVGAAGASSVTFTNIPNTYTHLQIRGIARTTEAVSANILNIRLNSDSGSNYGTHILYGDGASAGAVGTASLSYIYGSQIPGASATASIFAGTVIDILDYANTNKNTTVRSLGGNDRNGAGDIRLTSGVWLNTAAVTTVTITAAGGNNLAQYSQFALYGVKSV